MLLPDFLLSTECELPLKKKVILHSNVENNAKNLRLTCDATAFHCFLASRVSTAWGNSRSLFSCDDAMLSSVGTKQSCPDSIITVSRNMSHRKTTAYRRK